jgi:hypothetical protein
MDGGVADTACCTKAVESAEGRGRRSGLVLPAPKESASDNQSGRCKQQKWPDAIDAHYDAIYKQKFFRELSFCTIVGQIMLVCQLPTCDDDRTVTSQKPARHSQQTRTPGM